MAQTLKPLWSAVFGQEEIGAEEKSLFWSLGQRAHQAALALHEGSLAEVLKENGGGKRPVFRPVGKLIEFSSVAPGQQLGFGEQVIYSSKPEFAGSQDFRSIFQTNGEIDPMVKSWLKRLTKDLRPFPLSPHEFQALMADQDKSAVYLRLKETFGKIFGWPEISGGFEDLLSQFAQASTYLVIARELEHPTIKPGSAVLKEMPVGFFPFKLESTVASEETPSLTVGRPDEIIITSVGGQLPSWELSAWTRNTRSRYDGSRLRPRGKEYSFKNLLVDLYKRVGVSTELGIEVVEHKMQVGDAGPNVLLNLEQIKDGPRKEHLATVYEYLFGVLVVNALTKKMMKEEPEKFLGGLIGGSMSELQTRLERFMDRIDIFELEKMVKEENLGIDGRLIYHFPGENVTYRFRLDGENLQRIWQEFLLPTYLQAVLRYQIAQTVGVLVSALPGEVNQREVVYKKINVPEGWENWVVKSGRTLNLNVERFLEEAEIKSWQFFENAGVLVLQVRKGTSTDELRINLGSFNFRTLGFQGRLRLTKHLGFARSKEEKEELAEFWQERWSELSRSVPGAVIPGRVYQNQEGEFIPTEGPVSWNPWQRRPEISYQDLLRIKDREDQALGLKSNFSCLFDDHPDSKPSSHLYCSEGNWSVYCFGCRRRVFVSDVPSGAFDSAVVEKVPQGRIMRIKTPGYRISPELATAPVAAERSTIIDPVWAYYLDQFPGSPAEDYLGRVRGIDPQRAYGLGLVGYASGNVYRLIERGELGISLPDAADYGLIVEAKDRKTKLPTGEFYDWLRRRIVFPLFWTGREGIFNQSSGEVANFLARVIDGPETKAKFLKLKVNKKPTGSTHGIFGWDVVDQVKETGTLVVVVEAPLNTLFLRIQMGFDQKGLPVMALGGLGDKEILTLVKVLGVKELILGMDNDRAGREAYGRIKQQALPLVEKVSSLLRILIAIDPDLNPKKTVWVSGKAPAREYPFWKDANEIAETEAGANYRYRAE